MPSLDCIALTERTSAFALPVPVSGADGEVAVTLIAAGLAVGKDVGLVLGTAVDSGVGGGFVGVDDIDGSGEFCCSPHPTTSNNPNTMTNVNLSVMFSV